MGCDFAKRKPIEFSIEKTKKKKKKISFRENYSLLSDVADSDRELLSNQLKSLRKKEEKCTFMIFNQ